MFRLAFPRPEDGESSCGAIRALQLKSGTDADLRRIDRVRVERLNPPQLAIQGARSGGEILVPLAGGLLLEILPQVSPRTRFLDLFAVGRALLFAQPLEFVAVL